MSEQSLYSEVTVRLVKGELDLIADVNVLVALIDPLAYLRRLSLSFVRSFVAIASPHQDMHKC